MNHTLNLSLIAETLDPVTTKLTMPTLGNSSFAETIVPTHTFSTAPELDVLFVPGGAGTRSPNLNSTIEFVRERYPGLKYLVTVCTGKPSSLTYQLKDKRPSLVAIADNQNRRRHSGSGRCSRWPKCNNQQASLGANHSPRA